MSRMPAYFKPMHASKGRAALVLEVFVVAAVGLDTEDEETRMV